MNIPADASADMTIARPDSAASPLSIYERIMVVALHIVSFTILIVLVPLFRRQLVLKRRPHGDPFPHLFGRVVADDGRDRARFDSRNHFAFARDAGKLARPAFNLERAATSREVPGAGECGKNPVALFIGDDAVAL